ncbi:RNA-directed DNA polymerase [Candidatus Saccharibacteria bacterium]|nr:RNA-directed DNA polymerase [Candidatus Saccharibacteria bacterium]
MKLTAKNEDSDDKKWLENYWHRLMYELYISYLYARRGGKRGTFDEHKFEVFDFIHLYSLMEAIKDKKYYPSRGTAHIIFNPVIREIFAAAFRDRVVHHWIYMLIYDWWDKQFIFDSYSCREGKGTSLGVLRLQEQIVEAQKEYNERVWVIKLDIRGYFMSINRQLLYKRAVWGLNQQFKGCYGITYELAKFCLHEIIFDDPVKGAKKKGWPQDWRELPRTKSLIFQLPGIGIVIGNLTSQLLSNIYLDQLDKYVTRSLGWKYYGRYVDDFYFIVPESMKKKAIDDIAAIERFLKRLGLTLHPDKRSVQPAERGTAFLGAVIYPTVIHPGKRLKKNARKAFRDFANGEGSIETVVSYIGHMKYMKHHKFLSSLCEEVGLPKSFWMQYEK